jgi:glutamyl-tRNA synthetase
MEDLDSPRCVPGSAEQVIDELRWMGLEWDEGPDCGGSHGPYRQSQRSDLYIAAYEHLSAAGALYPCTCSRKDIAIASAPHQKSPVYPGTCRQRPLLDSRPTVWRFRVDGLTVSYHDAILGGLSQSLENEVGDFVIRRADNVFSYHLAVVVDDALMGVSDVVRGDDLAESTPRQIALGQALGFATSTYWHVPVMYDGVRRMAKRDGSHSIAQWREHGNSPGQFVGHLAASLGLVTAGADVSAAELLSDYDLESLQRCLRALKRQRLQPEKFL